VEDGLVASIVEIISSDSEPNFQTILINQVLIGEEELKISSHIDIPFSLILINEFPQFDTEIWVNNRIKFVSPALSDWSENIYQIGFDNLIKMQSSNRSPSVFENPEISRNLQSIKSNCLSRMFFNDWETVSRMHSIWGRNAAQLKTLLNSILTNHEVAFELIKNIGDMQIQNELNAEIDRCVYNYLSSSVSLVDLTRQLLRNYSNSEFEKRYLLKVAKVTSNPIFPFVSKLRVFAIHYALPISGSQMSWASDPSQFKFSIRATCSELLRFSGWDVVSRQYIESMGDSMDLIEILETHMTGFEGEWQWILSQRKGLHFLECFVHDEVVEELNWIMSRGAIGRPMRDELIPPPLLS